MVVFPIMGIGKKRKLMGKFYRWTGPSTLKITTYLKETGKLKTHTYEIFFVSFLGRTVNMYHNINTQYHSLEKD